MSEFENNHQRDPELIVLWKCIDRSFIEKWCWWIDAYIKDHGMTREEAVLAITGGTDDPLDTIIADDIDLLLTGTSQEEGKSKGFKDEPDEPEGDGWLNQSWRE